MSAQVTHQRCAGCPNCEDRGGHMTQIVSAAELRRVLRRDGESLDRPRDFDPLDEWDVEGEVERT